MTQDPSRKVQEGPRSLPDPLNKSADPSACERGSIEVVVIDIDSDSDVGGVTLTVTVTLLG